MNVPVSLTVAIPTYNRAGSAVRLAREILAQAEAGDEVLVADDGSTDGTAAAVSALPGVRLLRHETNLGMVPNWNACLQAATRDWVCLLHDDDDLAPGGLATLRRACALANGPALVAHRGLANTPRAADDLEDFRCEFRSPGSWAVLHSPQVPSGVTVHRAIIEAAGVFDPQWHYSADMEYFARVSARFPTLVIDAPLVVRINHHGDNFQFRTWQRPDFLSQLEDQERTILMHAGLVGEPAEQQLAQRMTDYLSYMFVEARRWRIPGLVRDTARRLRGRAGLNWRLRLLARTAALTGWSPPPKER